MARRSHALLAKNSAEKLSMLRVQSCCGLKAQVTQSEWTARPYPPWKNLPVSLLACCKSFHRFVTVKPGFHIIATIAAIAEKKKSLRWNFFYLSDHCRCDPRCDLWTFFFFFFTVIAVITAIVATIWKPGLRDRNTYTTLTDDLSLYRKCINACDPSQSWVLRK